MSKELERVKDAMYLQGLQDAIYIVKSERGGYRTHSEIGYTLDDVMEDIEKKMESYRKSKEVV